MFDIVGIDESGKSSAAGSMFLAGVSATSKKFYELELKDSKKLKYEKREELYYRIKQYAHIEVIKITSKEIDKYGLTSCYKNALNKIKEKFEEYGMLHDISFSFFFDGNTNYGVDNIYTIIKGDGKVKEIMAASIVARHYKDNEMLNYAKKYEQYGFERNFGYLTKEHKDAIISFGLTPIHRKTFKYKFLNNRKENNGGRKVL